MMSLRLTGDETALWQAAARVLDANWTGAATVPSPGLYPHQWTWDSAFVCVGLARYRWERAERELLSVFRGQWQSGLVPHIVFSTAVPRHGYFPGPELWRSNAHPAAPRGVHTSGLTQPPLHALAALRLHGAAADPARSRAFLAKLYPHLVAQHAYLARVRDVGEAGLVSICHPWESGLDNSPAWDRPMASLGVRSGHDRLAHLVMTLRDAGYGAEHLREEHPFAVEDPLFNATYLASSHALAEIAELIGEDPAPHREVAGRVHEGMLERLWDPGAGCFKARDLRAGVLVRATTVATFGPLLDPDLPPATVQSLADLMMSARFAGASGYPVPSCDIQSADFDRAAYWRGPTWINTNWLVWLGAVLHGLPVVADLVSGATLRLVRQSGFREYFDPFDGTGRGSHDFSWSAALVLDLLGSGRRSAAPFSHQR